MKTFFNLVYFLILVFFGSCFCQIMADWVKSGRQVKKRLKSLVLENTPKKTI